MFLGAACGSPVPGAAQAVNDKKDGDNNLRFSGKGLSRAPRRLCFYVIHAADANPSMQSIVIIAHLSNTLNLLDIMRLNLPHLLKRKEIVFIPSFIMVNVGTRLLHESKVANGRFPYGKHTKMADTSAMVVHLYLLSRGYISPSCLKLRKDFFE